METIQLARYCPLKQHDPKQAVFYVSRQKLSKLVMCLVTWHEFVFCSVPKHRIGTKRHRVCLEVPQEVSESEAFPKEELSSMQDEEDAAEPCERATGEVTQQSEQGHKVPGNCVKLYLGTAGPSVSVSRDRGC